MTVFTTRVELLRGKLLAERDLLSQGAGALLKPFVQRVRADIVKRLSDLDEIGREAAQNSHRLPQKRFADLERKSLQLFGECLAMRLAEFTRKSVGEVICTLADKLLAELVSAVAFDLPQFTTIADAEYIGGSSRIIRLRYPATSIWDLPVVGHEFGHCFGPHWYCPDSLEPYPREAFLKTSSLGSRSMNDEYFCDLFATYVVGPCYPAMCILERFDPTASSSDDDTHPPDVKRAWWVLRALELIAESTADPDEGGDLRSASEQLRRIWNGFIEECGTAELTDEETAPLEIALQKMIGKMRRGLPAAAYGPLAPAWGLVADYKDSEERSQAVSLRDLLNASWFLRLEGLQREERVEAMGKWAWNIARKNRWF